MKFLLTLIICCMLCGCSLQNDFSESTTIPVMSSELFLTDVYTEASIETTMATETTVPDVSISVPAGSHKRSYTDSETNDYLDYYLFVPENAEINMPLIVFLHGDGEVGDVELLEDFGIIRSARQIYGNEFPFIVVSPSTRIYSWIKGNIPATLKGLIDEVASECQVDPERIILTGHSRGSIGTWHMVSTYGNYFSAAVPVSADSEGMLNYDNLTSIPIWTIAGSYDTYYLDNMSSLVYMIRQAGGDIQFTILEDCHHGETSTRAYTQEVFEWMCAQ